MEARNRIVDGVEKLEEAIALVRKAQREYATYTQEQVDKIFFAAASAVTFVFGVVAFYYFLAWPVLKEGVALTELTTASTAAKDEFVKLEVTFYDKDKNVIGTKYLKLTKGDTSYTLSK